MTESKPTYEELEKENRKLKSDLNMVHHHIGRHMKSLNFSLTEFIVNAQIPYKLENPLLEIDVSHKNIDKYIIHYTV